MSISPDRRAAGASRASRLAELKARIDAVHEVVLRALHALDEATIDQAMEEQHVLLQEYRRVLQEGGAREAS
jgi:hypothetical protein